MSLSGSKEKVHNRRPKSRLRRPESSLGSGPGRELVETVKVTRSCQLIKSLLFASCRRWVFCVPLGRSLLTLRVHLQDSDEYLLKNVYLGCDGSCNNYWIPDLAMRATQFVYKNTSVFPKRSQNQPSLCCSEQRNKTCASLALHSCFKFSPFHSGMLWKGAWYAAQIMQVWYLSSNISIACDFIWPQVGCDFNSVGWAGSRPLVSKPSSERILVVPFFPMPKSNNQTKSFQTYRPRPVLRLRVTIRPRLRLRLTDHDQY